jgi:hypothetical protein
MGKRANISGLTRLFNFKIKEIAALYTPTTILPLKYDNKRMSKRLKPIVANLLTANGSAFLRIERDSLSGINL